MFPLLFHTQANPVAELHNARLAEALRNTLLEPLPVAFDELRVELQQGLKASLALGESDEALRGVGRRVREYQFADVAEMPAVPDIRQVPGFLPGDRQHVAAGLYADNFSAVPFPRGGGKPGAAAEVHNGADIPAKIKPDKLHEVSQKRRARVVVYVSKSHESVCIYFSVFHYGASLYHFSFILPLFTIICQAKRKPGVNRAKRPGSSGHHSVTAGLIRG